MLALPHALEGWLLDKLNWQPKILGTPLDQLTVTFEPDHVMVAAGGLMGIRTGVSMLVGACINYLVLAPWMIQEGSIDANADGAYGFREITKWSLWPGVAIMTTASLFAFFSKPQVILTAFSGLFGGEKKGDDCLKDIELPMSVFAIGIPILGSLTVYLAWRFFDVSPIMGAIAIPLVFVFTLIGANSTALTSITPTGALGKLTQLTFGVLAPGNIKTNLMTAGITGEVAGHASNLLMDIKPGYMLGGKPRQQAIGHALGIFAGALAAVPVFYYAFLKNDISNLASDTYPMPAAQIWRAVAELLTEGIEQPAADSGLGGPRRSPARHCLRGHQRGGEGAISALTSRHRSGICDSLVHLLCNVPGFVSVLARRPHDPPGSGRFSDCAGSGEWQHRRVPGIRGELGQSRDRAEPGTNLCRCHRRRSADGDRGRPGRRVRHPVRELRSLAASQRQADATASLAKSPPAAAAG